MCTSSEGVTRRQAMIAVAGAAAAFATGAIPMGWARTADGKTRKVLFYTKSAGFQHSVVTRKGEEMAHAEKIFIDLGKKNGFDVTVTKDGSIFTAEKLALFDVIAFYTTGDLTTEGTDKAPPMPKDGKEALLNFIRGGKGFVGFHCASDTFHSQGNKVDPYIKMCGAEFKSHGEQQSARIYPAPNGKFDPIKELKEFTLTEEWYEFHNFNPDMHVILVQDTSTMKQDQYKKQPSYPQTWARKEGKGRVFYTSLGHREDVWTNPLFHNILLGGTSWAAGNVEADVPGNFREATPGAMERAIKGEPAA
jgi:type 1 glutamine amidotransferase